MFISKPELKTRFIYAINGGKAIYNVDEARDYVALYNDYLANVVIVIHIGSHETSDKRIFISVQKE